MCGIAGCVSTEITRVSPAAIDQMRTSIRYRGLDDSGEWTDKENIVLLHTRLSIIDLNSGHQPMWDEGKRYVIVYNGEIYNYKELRDNLEAKGSHFYTESDTEVILEGYKVFGERVFKELNGMFAFAIWDKIEKRLIVARDHLGKKPLFWCEINGNFYFASTIEAFRGIPGWTDTLSKASIYQFLLLGSSLGENTIYEQAFSLPQASFAVIDPRNPELNPIEYWNFNFFNKSTRSFNELMDEYETILTDAIKIRLRSDVPLAHTFSGGVDSGTIASIATKKLNTALNCFTIDYHTPEDPSEETLIAQRVAGILNLNWEHIQFDYHRDLLKDLPNAYSFYDEPASQLPLVYSQKLYETIRPYAKVVLSGSGADELFTGYSGDEKLRQRDILYGPARLLLQSFFNGNSAQKQKNGLGSRNKFLSNLRHLSTGSIPKAFAASAVERLWGFEPDSVISSEVIASIEKMIKTAEIRGVSTFLDLSMYAAIFYNTRDANYRLPDISGLAAQVEVRSPFLDFRLVEFAARLPHRFKIGNLLSSENKYLPRKYYQRYVPKEIAWGRKRGMGANLRWDRKIIEDAKYIEQFSLAYETVQNFGINIAAIKREWENVLAKRPSKTSLMMRGFMLGSWLQLTKEENTVQFA